MRDQGGRNAYSSSASYGGAEAGSSSSAAAASGSGSGSGATSSYTAPTSSGYVPGPSAPSTSNSISNDKALPNSGRESSLPTQQQTSTPAASSSTSSAPTQTTSAPNAAASNGPTPPVAASRVRALYDFAPTEAGELPFQKGDIIRVLDSVYEHWWRGELKGEAGIFPVNYVEILPDRTPDDIQREAELEARIFAQATNIDKLLSKLRGLDASTDNLAEDDELQVSDFLDKLSRQILSLRMLTCFISVLLSPLPKGTLSNFSLDETKDRQAHRSIQHQDYRIEVYE